MSKYNSEEQRVIQELSKKDAEIDYNVVAEFFVNNAGNLDLNARLQEDVRTNKRMPSKEVTAKRNLAYFLFKTRNYSQSVDTLSKLDLARTQTEAGIQVEDFEKPTIRDIGALDDIATIAQKSSLCKKIFKNSDHQAFKDLYQNCQQAESVKQDLQELALQNPDYKSGDLIISLTSKEHAISGRKQKMMGHGGAVEEKFISKYMHAAPLFVDKSDPAAPQFNKSDIHTEQRNTGVTLRDMLSSDSFRIDPTKLVSTKHAAMLETIDYGNKQDKDGNDLKDKEGNSIKLTWKDVMRERYQLYTKGRRCKHRPENNKNKKYLLKNKPISQKIFKKLKIKSMKLIEKKMMSTHFLQKTKKLKKNYQIN